MPAPRNSVPYARIEPSLEARLLWCLREAVRRCYPKQWIAAEALGLTPGHLSEQLSGAEPFDLRRLARAPEAAHEFSALLAKALGHELAKRNTASDRKRRRAIALHCVELTRAILNDEDDDEPGAFPFLTPTP